MNSHLTIGRKLMLAFGGLIALLAILSFTFLSVVGTLNGTVDTAVNKTAKKMRLAGQFDTAESDMLAWQRGTLLQAFLKNPSAAETARQKFREAASAADHTLDELQPLIVDEEGRRILEHSRSGLRTWGAGFAEMDRLSQSDPAAAFAYAAQVTIPIYEGLAKDAQRLAEMQGALLDESTTEASVQNSRTRWIALFFIAISCVLATGVFVVVGQISRVLQRIAREMADGAGQVASAASQVGSSSQSLAQGASRQAASIEETSAATEEIHSMARRNTENSNSAAALVSQSQQKFDETRTSLEEMVQAMNEINNSSGKISKIIKVIDEIAFQTNILALNAAVEAARAGEAGLGFAVVADEVRNLAQRCAQAAKDTADLIEESVTKSTAGKVKVDQVAGAIRIVTEEAGKIKVLVDEISVGSQEQARGIEQIGTAITQMDQVTQKSAASAEEGASAAEELTAQSESLKTVAAELVHMVSNADGDRRTGKPQASKPREHGRGLTALAARVAMSGTGARPAAVKPEKEAFPLETEF